MDEAGAFAQRPGVATGETGLHLGEDGREFFHAGPKTHAVV